MSAAQHHVGIARAYGVVRAHPGLVAARTMLSWCDLRVREDAGQNRGRVVDAIQLIGGTTRLGEAWCLRAAYAAWHAAGWALGQRPNVVDGEVEDTGGTAKAWIRTHDDHKIPVDAAIDGRRSLLPGDIMIRVRDPDDREAVRGGHYRPGHAEIVTRQHTDGWLDTAGGNTSSRGSAEGQGCFRHPRGIHIEDPRILGFLRPEMEALQPTRGQWI